MDYRRLYRPGGHYFFTVVTANRRSLLVDHVDHVDHVDRLRAAFRYTMEKRPFDLEAIVILPDHLHALWRLPLGDADFSTRWMLVKRKFSTGLPTGPLNSSGKSKREKGIWQRRFWEHLIRDETDWRRHMDYIHFNPVKHRLVDKARDWPFSSFRRFVANGWYDEDWGEAEEGSLGGLELE